ncbi:MAG: sensor histidine kinase, partial [Burkholderiales bacterium]|nr:sensor histidine kinase [Burkholderiales bacterium]
GRGASGAPAGAAPQVVLSLTAGDDAALIRVDDDGPGIPPAEQAAAFDRFRRRGQGGSGSGLGLAIVRRVAEQHGGSAALSSSPLGGLRAEVRLPRPAPDAAP